MIVDYDLAHLNVNLPYDNAVALLNLFSALDYQAVRNLVNDEAIATIDAINAIRTALLENDEVFKKYFDLKKNQ